ncbi:MAG TPA: hypothetical protein VEZ44_14670 [bacterium]|nr:hypothetical protein [bacterium]
MFGQILPAAAPHAGGARRLGRAIRAAAATLVLLGLVSGGLTSAGAEEFLTRFGALDVPAGTVVHGDAIAIGGPLSVAGTVDGDAVALGGDVVVTGRVGGSVRAIGGNVLVRSTAVVGGTATTTDGRVTIEPGASVGRTGALPPGSTAPGPPPVPTPPQGSYEPPTWLWPATILGMLAAMKAFVLFFALAMLISFVGTTWLTAVFFPRVTQDLAGLLERAPALAFGVGLLTWAALWPLVIGLAISVVGLVVVVLIPLAVLAALQLGIAAISVLLGRRIRPSSVGLEALVGAVVLVVAFAIPHLGALLLFLTATWAVGVIVLALIERSRARPVAPPPPVAS